MVTFKNIFFRPGGSWKIVLPFFSLPNTFLIAIFAKFQDDQTLSNHTFRMHIKVKSEHNYIEFIEKFFRR